MHRTFDLWAATHTCKRKQNMKNEVKEKHVQKESSRLKYTQCVCAKNKGIRNGMSCIAYMFGIQGIVILVFNESKKHISYLNFEPFRKLLTNRCFQWQRHLWNVSVTLINDWPNKVIIFGFFLNYNEAHFWTLKSSKISIKKFGSLKWSLDLMETPKLRLVDSKRNFVSKLAQRKTVRKTFQLSRNRNFANETWMKNLYPNKPCTAVPFTIITHPHFC